MSNVEDLLTILETVIHRDAPILNFHFQIPILIFHFKYPLIPSADPIPPILRTDPILPLKFVRLHNISEFQEVKILKIVYFPTFSYRYWYLY